MKCNKEVYVALKYVFEIIYRIISSANVGTWRAMSESYSECMCPMTERCSECMDAPE